MWLLLLTLVTQARPHAVKPTDRAQVKLEKSIKEVQRSFEAQAYAKAQDRAQDLLVGETLTAAQQDTLVRIFAFSNFYLYNLYQASAGLRTLFKANPQANIDHAEYPPQLVDFFETEKEKFNAPPVTPAPASVPAPVATAPPPPRFQPLSLLPFGVGQIVQHDYLAGGLWMGIDAALFATDLTLYVLVEKDHTGTIFFRNPNGDKQMQIGEDIAAFALIATTIAGIADSIFGTPKRMHKTTQVTVTPIAASNSAGLMLSGEF